MKRKNLSRKAKLTLAGAGAGLSLACAALILFGYVSGPRPQGPSELTLHPERQEEIIAGRRAGELKTRLGLSDDQTAQLSQMLVSFRAELREHRRQNAGNPAARIAAGRQKLQGFADQIRGILTEEQRARFDAMREDRMQRMESLRGLIGAN